MSRDAKIWPFAGPSPSKSSPHAAAPISYPAGGDDAVNCYLFSHARTSLKHGMKPLKIGKGDRILMPDFNRDVALHPVEQLGAKPVFYPVTNSLTPNWAKLKKLAKGCRAILMVHYFGVSQDSGKFLEFCKTHDLLLLEDNAHGLGGVTNGKALGTIGDIGIASPRKVLPLTNGGALWISSKHDVPVAKTGLGPAPVEKSGLKPMLKGIAEKIPGAVKLLRRNRPAYHDDSAFQESKIPDWAMDASAVEKLDAVDWYEVRQARRKIYDVWQRWATSGGREKSLKSVFSMLPEGASPMVFAA